MPKNFLGVGMAYPVRMGNDGQLQLAEYEESVRQSIWIILGTSKGERVMRPNFGCGIYDLVFEPQSSTTAGRIAQTVREDLTKLEPRIDVLNVVVIPRSESQGEMLQISVDYRVRATNNAFNLVYPFYLERSTGQ